MHTIYMYVFLPCSVSQSSSASATTARHLKSCLWVRLFFLEDKMWYRAEIVQSCVLVGESVERGRLIKKLINDLIFNPRSCHQRNLYKGHDSVNNPHIHVYVICMSGIGCADVCNLKRQNLPHPSLYFATTFSSFGIAQG